MQKLAEICVRRPVFASMLIAAIVVVGGASFTQLGVDRYPRIETPVVSVTTSNPGATPESIEKEITDRIEAAVNTVAGIDELRSTSTEGQSRVTITFDLSKNPDVAAQEVRAKVDPVLRNLPETADPPVVQKQDPDSMPIMMFSISAPLPAVELTSFLEQNVQKRVESVNGVGEVILFGARRRQVQVKIDPDRLNAYELSTTDIAAALRAQNLELPGGRLEQGARELSVRTVGRLTRPDEFAEIVVATRGNIPIRIKDLGTVEDTGADPLSVSSLNGKSAISVAIRKQSGVNTVALADAIRARMAEVEKTLPPTFEVRLIRDDSEFIRASLAAIEEHLILGGFLAAIIVFIFLRNFRSTADRRGGDPGIDHRRLRRDVGPQFHHQPDDHARAHAHGRHRHRRCDRGAGEHLPVRRREGDDADACRRGGHEGDRPRRHGDHAVAAGGVPAGRLPRRDHRPLHVVVRPDLRRGDRDQPDRVFHPHADAGVALDQARPRRQGRRRIAPRVLSPHRPRLHLDADLLDGAPLGDRRCLRDGHRLDGAAVPRLRHQLHSRRGRIAVPGIGAAAGRIEPGGDHLADGADRPRHA